MSRPADLPTAVGGIAAGALPVSAETSGAPLHEGIAADGPAAPPVGVAEPESAHAVAPVVPRVGVAEPEATHGVAPVMPRVEVAEPESAHAVAAAQSLSPGGRAWRRFKRNRLGYLSLLILAVMLAVSTAAELLSHERPLIARYDGKVYFPIVRNHPEAMFGGDFHTPTDWHDPFIREQFARDGNWMLFTLNPWSANTADYFARESPPSPPTSRNWLGTDDTGRDMLARLLYGFRVSIWFGLALTFVGTLLGVVAGAIQGYFGGRVDLASQRVIEIWNALPELYLLIIFASIFEPSLLLLLVLLAAFGWISLSDYVRAEFLRNRTLEYVKAARAMGLSNWQIIRRHVLPNSMTPVITFLPFRVSAAILALTSLDFLGLGVPATTPSLGDLLRQGKDNLEAWWISVPTFALLVMTLLLLTFIGDALRDAFDTRKS